MAQRNGIPTILKIALRLCQLLDKFAPVLAVQFSGNAALLAAISAAQAACQVLTVEAAKVREVEQFA